MAKSMFSSRSMTNKELVKQIKQAIQYIEEVADPADEQAVRAMRKMLQALYQASWMISQMPPYVRAK